MPALKFGIKGIKKEENQPLHYEDNRVLGQKTPNIAMFLKLLKFLNMKSSKNGDLKLENGDGGNVIVDKIVEI